MADFQTDSSGNIIDPPVIAEHEQRLAGALASADPDRIRVAHEDYDKERKSLVKRLKSSDDKDNAPGRSQQPSDSTANQDARTTGKAKDTTKTNKTAKSSTSAKDNK